MQLWSMSGFLSIYGIWVGIFDDIWLSGWWFGTFFIFPYIGKNHPKWRTKIFFRRGRSQPPTSYIMRGALILWNQPLSMCFLHCLRQNMQHGALGTGVERLFVRRPRWLVGWPVQIMSIRYIHWERSQPSHCVNIVKLEIWDDRMMCHDLTVYSCNIFMIILIYFMKLSRNHNSWCKHLQCLV